MPELLLALALVNSVQSIDYALLHAGEVLIRIELARPLTQPPSGFRMFHPAPRVVLELPETSVTDKKTIQPERGIVRSIRLLGHASGTRVVIELNGPATYELALEGKALLVTLRRTPPARPGDRWERFGAVPPQNLLRDLRFERGPSGEGRVLVNAAAMTGIDVQQQGRRLIVSFRDTGIDAASERRLDVLDFATPIEAIEARSAGRDALVVIETSGSFEYAARQSDSEFTLTVAPASR
jgi:type IV pilus assembly protein PilQ